MTPKLPWIATGLAVTALATAIVAVGVVVSRGEPREQVSLRGIESRQVTPAQLAALGGSVDWIATGSELAGVRVTDPDLERDLGLHPGDRIYALAGRQLARAADVADVLRKISLLGATTIYVELSRPGELALMRWQVTSSGQFR